MTADTKDSGMAVIDIKLFWNALRLTWFKRALKSNDFWVAYLNSFLQENKVENVEELLSCGDQKLKRTASKIGNKHIFWKNAIETLGSLAYAYYDSSRDRKLQCPLYDTKHFYLKEDNQTIYFPKYAFPNLSKSFKIAGQIYLENRCIDKELMMSGEHLKTYFEKNYYEKLGQATITSINNMQDTHKNYNSESFMQYIEKSKGTSNFRKLLTNQTKTRSLEDFDIIGKWEKRGISLKVEEWQKGFTKFHKFPLSPEHKYLQWRIIQYILGLNYLVSKFKPEVKQYCTFCCNVNSEQTHCVEKIENLFFNCPLIKQLWLKLEDWEPMKILGYRAEIEETLIYADRPGIKHTQLLGSAIILGKYYIMECRNNKKLPTEFGIKCAIMTQANFINYMQTITKAKLGGFDIFECPWNYERSGLSLIHI